MTQILEAPTALIMTKEEHELYEENRKYCKKYFYMFHLVYCNPVFGSIFSKKKARFLEKMSLLKEFNRKKSKIFKYKVAQAIASDNYSVNEHFGHYTFGVDGKSHTYGIAEIDPNIFETAKFLKKQNNNKKDNVVSIFKNKK